jgi:hypothetical protein
MEQPAANVKLIQNISFGVNLVEKDGKKYIKGNTYNDRDFFLNGDIDFDREMRAYPVTDEQIPIILQYYGDKERRSQILGREMWKLACANLCISYAKKDTPEYDKVKEEYKRLLKEKTNQ